MAMAAKSFVVNVAGGHFLIIMLFFLTSKRKFDFEFEFFSLGGSMS